MAEYIEREKVLKLISGFKRNDVTKHCVDYAAGWNEALEQIESNVAEDIPTTNVLERHGEWKRVSDDDQDEGWYFCSECKEKYFNPAGDDYYMLPNFCLNCGAKMDGKDAK